MKNREMFLLVLVSVILVFSLIPPALAARASSAPVSVPDDDSISCLTMDGSSLASGMALNTPEGEVTPMVAAGWNHIVGLRADGAVLATGYNDARQCDVRGWADIVQVAAGSWQTLGVKDDGTVVAAGFSESGQTNVGGWTNITQVAAGHGHTVGLKSDGIVVAVGANDRGECEVGDWTDIVQVATSGWYTAGVKVDGTVVAVGYNY